MLVDLSELGLVLFVFWLQTSVGFDSSATCFSHKNMRFFRKT